MGRLPRGPAGAGLGRKVPRRAARAARGPGGHPEPLPVASAYARQPNFGPEPTGNPREGAAEINGEINGENPARPQGEY